MKSFRSKGGLLLTCLAATAMVAAACNSNNDGGKEETGDILSFKAVSSSSSSTAREMDVAVTVGEDSYKFSVDLHSDKTLSFEALYQGKANSGNQGGGNQGGPGGGGFPGGGDFGGGGMPGGEGQGGQEGQPGQGGEQPGVPGGDNGGEQPGGEGGEQPGTPGEAAPRTRKNAEDAPAAGAEESAPVESSVRDSSKDFTWSGTWKEDDKKGFGYVITIKDNTEIHVDYLKQQTRHDFYYDVVIGENKATVHFQAEDNEYKDKLADDYVTWPERNAEFVFSTGSNYLYLEKDSKIITATFTGANRDMSVTSDTWSKSGDTLTVAGVVADNSINSARTGYRVIYNEKAYFCCTTAGVANNKMTNSDFDGAALITFEGEYSYSSGPTSGAGTGSLDLTNIGKAVVSIDGSAKKVGTYTQEGTTITLKFAGEDDVVLTPDANGTYSYTYSWSVSSFFGSITVNCVMTYTPEA